MIPYSRLTDGQVILRPFQFSDVSDLYEAVRESLQDLKPWMSWAHEGYSLREASDFIAIVRARWEEGMVYAFAIMDANDERFLGGCSLSHIHPVYQFCNLGYWVRSKQRGKGIAGRAARLAARFGMERLNLMRIEVVVADGNSASLRVAEKIGAHREGLLRKRIIVGRKALDAVMYSLVPEDMGLKTKL